jgi:hypothetical protein
MFRDRAHRFPTRNGRLLIDWVEASISSSPLHFLPPRCDVLANYQAELHQPNDRDGKAREGLGNSGAESQDDVLGKYLRSSSVSRFTGSITGRRKGLSRHGWRVASQGAQLL